MVDLCFGRHEVLLNSKLNHIDLRFALVNIKFNVQLHIDQTEAEVNMIKFTVQKHFVHLNISQ